ncbi:MAG: alkylphosphonate utilization protein [Bdellovibrionales bacterium]|nr:alkylphosphonate utilization protein [Bdellovibrionales bacterium]
MSDTPSPCPKCSSTYTYQDGILWICPECSFEWNPNEEKNLETSDSIIVKDANGNVLNDGDSVTVIKNLKVKGSTSPIKAGTKVKNIRLEPDSPDGHNIACKIDGFGAMGLKSEFVKKI